MTKIDIEIIGLSVMGRSLALNMVDHGFKAGGYNRSAAVTRQVVQEHFHGSLVPLYDLEVPISSLTPPRRVTLTVQAGKPMNATIDQLAPPLEQGDIIMDGGNSFYRDTVRRVKELEEKGTHYLGVGISRGEEGARFGPPIMPGDNGEAYESVCPIPEAIVTRVIGEPCCAYIGPGGAGHYVKVVHNGIEYTDTQLIVGPYLLLKYVGGFINEELADAFYSWDQGELHSHLTGVTADIFGEQDDLDQGRPIDSILDSAKQKGTGRWASIEVLKQGVDIFMITFACTTCIMSNHLESRGKAVRLILSPDLQIAQDKKASAHMVHVTLYIGKIITYTQGFVLMQDASSQYGWNLDLGRIATTFRAGCIIQVVFLNGITHAFEARDKPENLVLDTFFLSRANEHQDSLRTVISAGALNGLPVPALCNAISHLDALRAKAAGVDLIQAQWDCFGTYTYERTDRQGTFHHQWRRTDEN